MDQNKAIQYLFWGIIAIVLIISFFIVKNFLIPLVSAFILAYLLKPVYNKLEKPLGKTMAAGLTIGAVLLIIISTIGFIINSLISQIPQLVNQEFSNKIIKALESLPFEGVVKNYIPELVNAAHNLLLDMASSILSEIPKRVIGIFITFFATFYLLIEWDNLKTKIKEILPFKNKHAVMDQIENVIGDIIKGTFLLAIIETVVASIGFLILGVKFALLLGVLIGIFAFIPALGPIIVWVPVALIELVKGNYFSAIGVAILGIILSIYVDNILRIKLMGKKVNIHPVVMLVGIFGGVSLFGLVGFILGPLVLSILITLIENIPKIKDIS